MHPEWTYTYVLVEGPRPTDPVLSRGPTWESDGARWVDPGDAPALPLHPALRADWPWLVGELEAG